MFIYKDVGELKKFVFSSARCFIWCENSWREENDDFYEIDDNEALIKIMTCAVINLRDLLRRTAENSPTIIFELFH